jgi:hypothetical protein
MFVVFFLELLHFQFCPTWIDVLQVGSQFQKHLVFDLLNFLHIAFDHFFYQAYQIRFCKDAFGELFLQETFVLFTIAERNEVLDVAAGATPTQGVIRKIRATFLGFFKEVRDRCQLLHQSFLATFAGLLFMLADDFILERSLML